MFLRIATAILALWANLSYAGDWGTISIISSTMGVHGSRLCLGEATRGDVGCPTYAPSLTTAGDVSVTGNLSAAKFIGDGSGLTGVGGGGGAADTISSGTTSIVVQSGGVISITTNGVTANYFDTAGLLVTPGISVTTGNGISTTGLYSSGDVSATSFIGDGSQLTGVAPAQDVQVFTSSGTWTKPARVSFVEVFGVGGGGGGGGGTKYNGAVYGGGGGAGGTYGSARFFASMVSSTVAISLGSGGTAGLGKTSGAGGNGGNGAATTFGTLFTTPGGGGGTGTAYTYGYPGSNGGTGLSFTIDMSFWVPGTVAIRGGAGISQTVFGTTGGGAGGSYYQSCDDYGNCSYPGTAGNAGGGIVLTSTCAAGGAANLNANGSPGYFCTLGPLTLGTGGGGGWGKNNTAYTGGAGGNYGGGGGGGGGYGNGGAGAPGMMVVISY